ncbi:MAG TPA: transporter substrate-binding domain-containing protein [Kaistia sp.]|jgi:ABC-type branched-subunit amino acid transport system substrate-binding protein|uniref:Transporter substrate-binding domain-containing protein n=2 Tax=Ancylobacter pratisalsi TaxID=1745854 RepID=A0A6P1YU47_9HYPH|nr:transporter substrate-binding domain-containing protein [Ancylobacter pratisalsi]HWJ73720.1 transporter substrate-binding domain-containing protein [Kaistia sp.]
MEVELEGWPVGVLFSHSGVTSMSEISQLQGTLLAIDEINDAGGVGGRAIQPIIKDPASDPTAYARLAANLILEEGAANIFGCSSSFSRKAVLPWIERRGGLLWYSVVYEGFEYSPNIIYTGPTINQTHLPLANYLFRHVGKRFFLIGSDYLFPRESNRVIRDIVEDVGGTILGEHYVPLSAGYETYAEAVACAAEADADVIFSTVIGPGTSHLYDSHNEAGLDARRMPIAALTTSEVHLRAMRTPVGAGHLVCAPYFESLKTAENLRFVERYRARYGSARPADGPAEAAYSTVHLFAKALADAGTTDPERVRAAVLGQHYLAPEGLITVDPDNSHTYIRPRIAVTTGRADFRIVEEAPEPVKPDPYLVYYEAPERCE